MTTCKNNQGVDMFEKEAEERAEKYFYKNNYEENRWADTHDLANMWQDGAEFGYNKANEWHYNGVPDRTHSSCLIFIKRLPQIRIAYWNCKVWKETLTEDIHDKDEVKAWKYLDFPKESE